MKSFTKFCLILAGAAAAIGIAAIAVGMALGAKPGQFLKFGHRTSYISSDDSDSSRFVCGTADTEEINLDVSWGSVKIYTHEEDAIEVRASDAGDYLKIREDGKKVTIQDHRNRFGNDLVLELYLPERQMEKISLELGAGELYADGLNAKKLEAEVGVGSLSVTVPGDEQDYDYELECGIGDIELDGRSLAGLGNELETDNHADRKISMECGIGDMQLYFEN